MKREMDKVRAEQEALASKPILAFLKLLASTAIANIYLKSACNN
jgi:hypothetical protein